MPLSSPQCFGRSLPPDPSRSPSSDDTRAADVASPCSAALAGWPKDTVSDAAAAKQTIPLMYGIPRNPQLRFERTQGRARAGEPIRQGVTDRGQAHFIIVTPATLDIRRVLRGRWIRISLHT